LATTFESSDPRLVQVRRDACEACCLAAGQSPARFNHVLASLIYHRALRYIHETPRAPDADRFASLKQKAVHGLAPAAEAISRAPGGLGVTSVGERRVPRRALPESRPLEWACAVLTAPRRAPTLSAALASLRVAGFDRVHLFAEPEADIPAALSHMPLTRHRERQGQLRNFCCAAKTLLAEHPAADCYAIFEDDISAAQGLREWCDGEFWPGDHGIVSLYTSRVYCDERPGWQTLNLGHYRTFGALAFVFRGPELRQLLSDAGVLEHLERGHPTADAVVGGWALKRGVGIAYHSPSLIQHRGETTSIAGHDIGRVGHAVAVERVADIAVWRRPQGELGRVGLVGWNTASGLGYLNRDLALHLPVTRWLAPRHPHFTRLSRPRMSGAYHAPWRQTVTIRELRAWLNGLDWVLFTEQPYVPNLAQHARELGISVACVPMWEWLTTRLDWLPYVDLMICPTRATYDMLLQWRRDYGFAWDVVHVPWPIDPGQFPFRQRQRCRRFLFVNGTAGGRARRLDGSDTAYRRKGVELIAATARLLDPIPFLMYSQDGDLPAMPSNVEVRKPPKFNGDLYREGDVCVQPSHWEGLGLQLLECQAAGLPLVTTDAPPMNECHPFRAAPVSKTEMVFVYGDQPVDAHCVDPRTLAAILRDIYDTDIGAASRQAREHIEQERSWKRMREAVACRLTD
jgi:glycosyltransferase involved in cell wall biosynthesis